jgi:protein-S-isoprenylcysteine O-methyltransferase Ste14
MTSPPDPPPSNEKKLRLASFAIHAARGLVRNQKMRRTAMFWTVLAALLLLFCGATFLAPVLDPQIRPGWFIFYWLACAWITVTAVLLAIFDLLLVRVQARAVKRALEQQIIDPPESDDAD